MHPFRRVRAATYAGPFETPVALLCALYGLLLAARLLGGHPVPGRALSEPVLLLWALALGVGGAVTLVGLLGAWWRVESAGLALMTAALAWYGLALSDNGARDLFSCLTYLLFAFGGVCRLRVLAKARTAREVAQ